MLIISIYQQLFGAGTCPGPISQNAELMGQQVNCFIIIIIIIQASLLPIIEIGGYCYCLELKCPLQAHVLGTVMALSVTWEIFPSKTMAHQFDTELGPFRFVLWPVSGQLLSVPIFWCHGSSHLMQMLPYKQTFPTTVPSLQNSIRTMSQNQSLFSWSCNRRQESSLCTPIFSLNISM